MKIAYFDCFSGISGDMCLGALVDAGVSVKKLSEELKKIPMRGYEIHAKKVRRADIAATKVDVIERAKGKERRAESKEKRAKRWQDIEKIIHKSSLSEGIKEKGLKVFKRLFKAEAKVHGNTFKSVHVHELGATDCLIDILGTIIGLDILKIEKVYFSPVNLGSGSLKTDHGILPVPAPASAEILKGVPVYSSDINYELTTPTGASLVKELSKGFGTIPLMNIKTIGLGAGNRNFKDRPNVLRILLGEQWPPENNQSNEKIMVIEANIDDMNPQVYEYVMEKLFKAGALDVFLTQVIMKKGRPAIKLTALCKETDCEELINIIMGETTTIGLRFYEVKRRVLQREIKLMDTEFGKVRVKFTKFRDDILKATPEYEDCKKIARKLKTPLIEIMRKIRIPLTK